MILKTDLANLYYNRFDNIPAKNSRDHWIDALRLSKTFNEHPITFKRRYFKIYISNLFLKFIYFYYI